MNLSSATKRVILQQNPTFAERSHKNIDYFISFKLYAAKYLSSPSRFEGRRGKGPVGKQPELYPIDSLHAEIFGRNRRQVFI